MTVDEARVKARDELSRIDKGHDPKAARIAAKSRLTFGDYLEAALRAVDAGAAPAHDSRLERLQSRAFAELPGHQPARADRLSD